MALLQPRHTFEIKRGPLHEDTTLIALNFPITDRQTAAPPSAARLKSENRWPEVFNDKVAAETTEALHTREGGFNIYPPTPPPTPPLPSSTDIRLKSA